MCLALIFRVRVRLSLDGNFVFLFLLHSNKKEGVDVKSSMLIFTSSAYPTYILVPLTSTKY